MPHNSIPLSARRTGRATACAALALLLASGTGLGAHAQDAFKAPPPIQADVAGQAIVREALRLKQPESIDELKAIDIGGIKQWISVRGTDRRNPILLFIHGGPGVPEMPSSWIYQRAWEDYFTVVQWDQRGTGKTGASNDPKAVIPTVSLDRMVGDGEEVIDYLRKTYGKRKIFVLGHSWGSIIGLRIAQAHPDWLHAYIGMGQFIDTPENEQLSYDFALSQARQHGDAEAIKQLQAIAPYPGPLAPTSIFKLATERSWVIHYGGLSLGRSDSSAEQDLGRLSPQYTDADLNAPGSTAVQIKLIPDLLNLDFRPITSLDCPVFIMAARYDYETPSAPAIRWLKALQAPRKQLFWFEHASHEMQQDQPGTVFLHLVRDIRPIAVSAGDAPPDEEGGAGGE